MLIASTMVLLALTVLMIVAARNLLFPPVLFAGSWALSLMGLVIVGDLMYEVGDYALLVFVVGALAFSAGGIVGLLYQYQEVAPAAPRRVGMRKTSQLVLDCALLVSVLAFPYAVRVAMDLADGATGLSMLAAIRVQTVAREGENLFGPIAGNLTILSSLVALAMVYEANGGWQRRWRAIIAVLLALGYSALSGSKGGAIFLITVYFIAEVRTGRLRVAVALGSVGTVLAFFVGGLLIVNFVGTAFGSVTDVMSAAIPTVANYVLGSPVAFGQIVENSDVMTSSSSIWRFFEESARSFGFVIDVPSLHQEFVAIGPGLSSNTYTIYFSYFKDYGWGGTVLLLGGLGAFLTVMWRRAAGGRPIAALMYAQMCKGLVLSSFAEHFFVGLNGLIKAYVFYWIVYRALPWLVDPWCRREVAVQ